MEETNQIFQPIIAVPVPIQTIPSNTDAVFMELGVQKTIPTTNVKDLTGNVPTVSENVTSVVLNTADTAQDTLCVARNSPLVPIDNTGVRINSPGAIQDVVMCEEGHTDRHGALPKSGQFLPVEGGYILVADNAEHGNLYFFLLSIGGLA